MHLLQFETFGQSLVSQSAKIRTPGSPSSLTHADTYTFYRAQAQAYCCLLYIPAEARILQELGPASFNPQDSASPVVETSFANQQCCTDYYPTGLCISSDLTQSLVS